MRAQFDLFSSSSLASGFVWQYCCCIQYNTQAEWYKEIKVVAVWCGTAVVYACFGTVYEEISKPLKLEDSSRTSSDYSIFNLRQKSSTKDEDFFCPKIKFF